MTTLPQQITIKQYLADGLSTVFIYPFMILEDGDLAVYVTPPGQEDDPTQDRQKLNVDFTVQDAGNINGGTITFTTAPAALSAVTVSREIEAKVDTNFEDARTFSGENLDFAFLRSTLVEQANRTYATRRNLSYRITSYLPDAHLTNYTQLPLLGTNQIWKGSENGVTNVTLEENPDVSTLRSDLENDNTGTDGARLIGYYDDAHSLHTTVHDELSKLNSEASIFGTDTGVENALQLTASASVTEYYSGMEIRIIPAFTNSLASTIQVNALGTKNIKRTASINAQPEDIRAGELLVLIYDGTQFIIANRDLTPSGVIIDFGGTTAAIPNGYVACDGAAYSKTTYSALYAVCAAIWGAEGATTFVVPNLARRTTIGSGGTGTATIANTTGSLGGEEGHVITIPESAGHTHTSISGRAFTTFGDPPTGNVPSGGGGGVHHDDATTSSVGGNQAHNTMQPSAVVTKIIKI